MSNANKSISNAVLQKSAGIKNTLLPTLFYFEIPIFLVI